MNENSEGFHASFYPFESLKLFMFKIKFRRRWSRNNFPSISKNHPCKLSLFFFWKTNVIGFQQIHINKRTLQYL